MADRGPAGSNPPASPSVTMQYETCSPSSVKVAIVPAAPKSTSSGCATTTSTRSTTYSSTMASPSPRPSAPILRDDPAGRAPAGVLATARDGRAAPSRRGDGPATVDGFAPQPLGEAVYAVPVHRAIVAT